MSLLVDTSVWSLALRRDAGFVIQELLQGVVPERARTRITETFAVLEYLAPTREDHVDAAGIRNTLRQVGIQVGTIDALIAQLAIAGNHTLLTTDADFHLAAGHVDLRLWAG
jgi:hypothetical protein